MEIKVAQSDKDILKCWEVLKVLRPHLEEKTFLQMMQKMMKEGFILAFIEEGGKGVSVVGYRYLHSLFNGKHYYIDDLSTLPDHQGKGYAGQLLDFVFEKAKEQDYGVVTLDSGHQRFDAHRLYLNKGFTIVSHHFSKKL